MAYPTYNHKYRFYARVGGSFLDFDLDKPNRSAFQKLMREVNRRKQERRTAFAKGRGYVGNK